jgi:hypothetical protein
VGDTVEVTAEKGGVAGFGYDRLLDEDVSVGGQVLSNGTATLNLGFDF